MKILLILLFVSTPLMVVGQEPLTVVITLKAGNDHPTAEQVLEEGSLQPPPAAYMLSSFNAYPPAKVSYLMKLRAYGDLKDLMEAKPDWSRAKMERSLIVSYVSVNDSDAVLQAMRNDNHILMANISEAGQLHAQVSTSNRGVLDPDWHLQAVNWHAAPNASSAFGHLGYVDTGAPTDRPEFEPFDLQTSNYLGGGLNLSQSITLEYGDRDIRNLRALNAEHITGGKTCDQYDATPGDGVVFPSPKYTGHGSHVGGLLIANDSNQPGLCPSCNLSGASIFKHFCREEDDQDGDPSDSVVYSWDDFTNLWQPSLRYLVDSGRQSINLSLGRASINDECHTNSAPIECTALSDAKARNIAIIASAGNFRAEMRFPAFDRDVIGVGGIDSSLRFWNQSPTNGNHLPPLDNDAFTTQDTSNCPFAFDPNRRFRECGSNFSKIDEVPVGSGNFVAERYRRIDVVAPAQDVISTLPFGSEYNPFVGDFGCTDLSDGVVDGFGPCTGTSMAAPIVTGIVQMIRSANPLLPIGDDDPSTLEGIRDVLLYSGSHYQSTRAHDPWMGFGIPDTQLAVETVLGVSGGQKVKNRMTPLFAMHNKEFNDTTYTVFPQIALAYALNPSGFYQSATGNGTDTTSELTQYPVEHVDGEPISTEVPRAVGHVFTTQWNPLTQTETLIPLYRMEKVTVSVPGCIPGFQSSSTCQVTARQTVMATDVSELESFHALGYEMQGIEGYLVPCPNGTCPSGYARMFRVYDTNTDSYYLTQILPPSNFEVLGATLPSIDFDGDGLSKGMEQLLGTSDLQIDTDGDGLTDAKEYPPAGVPYSDPLISDLIFEHGFE